MNHILLTIVTVTVLFGISFLATGMVRRRLQNKMPFSLHIIISLLAGVMLCLVAGFFYLNIHYSAEEEALAVLSDPDGATVTKIDGGYRVDGPGERVAMIFYPGVKVDTEAYLPLMKRIADNGVDCFLADMPLRLALLNKNAADQFISHYSYDCWLLGGHSMGGMVAAGYAAQHPDKVDGVVLLAAYPNEKMNDAAGLLSIYGTEDGVLNRKAYEKPKPLFSPLFTEIVMNGGNHSQFGSYHLQSDDGEASITASEQQAQTAFAIRKFADEIAETMSDDDD